MSVFNGSLAWFLCFIVSCTSPDPNEHKPEKKADEKSMNQTPTGGTDEKKIAEQPYAEPETKWVSSHIPMDTASLLAFWDQFQGDLKAGHRTEVINVIQFPIHAIFPVLFRYAHDCDTAAYMKNEAQYLDFDIDSSNIEDIFLGIKFNENGIALIGEVTNNIYDEDGFKK